MGRGREIERDLLRLIEIKRILDTGKKRFRKRGGGWKTGNLFVHSL
jgi:hypothetical protein